MDRKTKIFWWVVVLLVSISVGLTAYRYLIKRDYSIRAAANCDPYSESCFVHVCDPDPNVDGPDACKGNLTDDTWFTKNISRMAYNIPDCDPANENCTALVCGDGEAYCSYELCDETNVPEGDTCNDPAQYSIDNPPTDNNVTANDVTCDPGIGGCNADAPATDSTE